MGFDVTCGRLAERVEASFGDDEKWANLLKSVETTEARRIVLRTCVKHGRVDLLEEICKRGWHKCDGAFYDIMCRGASDSQLAVLNWLDTRESDFIIDREDMQFYLDVAIESAITSDNVSIFKYFWDKILPRGPGNLIGWKHSMCTQAVGEWAPHILEEFLFDALGRDAVLKEVRSMLDEEGFEYMDEARAFLNKHQGITRELKCAMQLLDEIRDIIPEGHYLKMSNHLMNAYNSVL